MTTNPTPGSRFTLADVATALSISDGDWHDGIEASVNIREMGSAFEAGGPPSEIFLAVTLEGAEGPSEEFVVSVRRRPPYPHVVAASPLRTHGPEATP